MRDDYLSLVLATYVQSKAFDAQVGEGWIFDEDYGSMSSVAVASAFESFGYNIDPFTFEDLFGDLFSLLVSEGAVEYDGDEYAGQWFRFNRDKKNTALAKLIQRNAASKRVQTLGRPAFDRALANIISEIENTRPDQANDVGSDEEQDSVPAAGRIVSLSHNQRLEIEGPLDDIIKKVEDENQIGDEDGLRELIIGKIKAGRELVRASVFSIQTLHLTLVVGLKMLVEKYEDMAIGIAAAKLIDLLVAQIGVAA